MRKPPKTSTLGPSELRLKGKQSKKIRRIIPISTWAGSVCRHLSEAFQKGHVSCWLRANRRHETPTLPFPLFPSAGVRRTTRRHSGPPPPPFKARFYRRHHYPSKATLRDLESCLMMDENCFCKRLSGTWSKKTVRGVCV